MSHISAVTPARQGASRIKHCDVLAAAIWRAVLKVSSPEDAGEAVIAVRPDELLDAFDRVYTALLGAEKAVAIWNS
jgi:hypothetical protein